MSDGSKKFRKQAAHELRKSRNGGTPAVKEKNRKRAAAYKALAGNEEWLDGEKGRGKTQP